MHLTHESNNELKLILFGLIPIYFISSNKLIASFNLFFLPQPFINVLYVISSNYIVCDYFISFNNKKPLFKSPAFIHASNKQLYII